MKSLLTGLIALAIANNLCAQSNLPTIPIKESGFGIIGGAILIGLLMWGLSKLGKNDNNHESKN